MRSSWLFRAARHVILAFAFTVLPGLAGAADTGRWQLTGLSLEDAYAAIASDAGIDLVIDAPTTTVGKFTTGESTYFEEALQLLATVTNTEIRREYGVWIVVPRGTWRQRFEKPRLVVRQPQWRPATTVAAALSPLVGSDVRVIGLPAENAVVLYGPAEDLSLARQHFEVVDTPVHLVRLDVAVRDGTSAHVIASCSALTLGHEPWTLTQTGAGPRALQLSVTGRAQVNDDGQVLVHATLAWQTQQPQASGTVSLHLPLRDGLATETTHIFGTQSWKARWQATFTPCALVAPASASTAPVPTDTATPQGAAPTPDQGRTEPGSDNTRTAPVVIVREPVEDAIEKMVRLTGRELISNGTASGTITVIGRGDNDPEALLWTVCRVKHLSTRQLGNAYVVGPTEAMAGLDHIDRALAASRRLQFGTARAAAAALNLVNTTCGIAANIVVDEGNNTISHGGSGRCWTTWPLIELLDHPQPAAEITLDWTGSAGTLQQAGTVRLGAPVATSHATASATTRIELSLGAGNADGLSAFRYHIETRCGSASTAIDGLTRMPRESVLPIAHFAGSGGSGCLAVRALLASEPASPYDNSIDDEFGFGSDSETIGSGTGDAFDKAFDNAF